MIEQSALQFLKEIAKHNKREWFEAHKDVFVKSKDNIQQFMLNVEKQLNQSDMIADKKLFRIYRDVRFSKNKAPFKNYFSGYFMRKGAERRGSYYFSIEPGNTQIGGGFYGPNKADLLRIRKEFEADGETIERIVTHPTFVKNFGELRGNGVTTAPKGFDKQHPNIQWIRMKQFYAFRKFSDEEVTSPSFEKEVNATFLAIRPFFDYMSEVLTTNLNGESILNK